MKISIPGKSFQEQGDVYLWEAISWVIIKSNLVFSRFLTSDLKWQTFSKYLGLISEISAIIGANVLVALLLFFHYAFLGWVLYNYVLFNDHPKSEQRTKNLEESLRRHPLGCLGGSVGSASDSWFQLRS